MIAAQKSVQEICDFVGLDSLGYLNIDYLDQASHIPKEDLCFACFNGKCPVPIDENTSKYCLE